MRQQTGKVTAQLKLKTLNDNPYIRKHMIDKKLFGKYTLQGLLDELDIIECFKQPGKDPYIGEILTKQRDIYCAMDVQAPESIASLCVDAGM